MNLISRVMENDNVRETVESAAKKITPEKVQETAGREEELRKKYAKVPGWFGKQINKVKLMFSMIKDYANGSYRKVPWTTIAMITFAIIYFLWPADLIPDMIPIAGYIDDAGVIAFVFAAVEHDLALYAQWKNLSPKLFW